MTLLVRPRTHHDYSQAPNFALFLALLIFLYTTHHEQYNRIGSYIIEAQLMIGYI